MNVSAIAVSGVWSAMRAHAVSASNVANVSTPGFRPATVAHQPRPGGGVTTSVIPGAAPAPVGGDAVESPLSGTDLVSETVAQLGARRAFSANLVVLRADREMQAELVRVTR